jgi:hypothetical protein
MRKFRSQRRPHGRNERPQLLPFSPFFNGVWCVENGRALDLPSESRFGAIRKMVENGEKWSKNGGT